MKRDYKCREMSSYWVGSCTREVTRCYMEEGGRERSVGSKGMEGGREGEREGEKKGLV